MLTKKFVQARSILYFWTKLALLLILLLSVLSIYVYASPTDTPVGGPIVSDTTWTSASSPYIVTSNVQVMVGVTLTIEPGVVIKFDSGKVLQVDGSLVAQGNSTNQIVFTSNQPNPQPEDWEGIVFSDSSTDATFDNGGNYISGSILMHCVVEHARIGINIDWASPFIDSCYLHNNSWAGISGRGTQSVPVMISDNIVTMNGIGISVDYGMIDSNTVTDNAERGIVGGDSTITNNFVSGNLDGGIEASGDTVMNNIIIGNTADEGGGIYTYFGSPSTIMNNVISNNTADVWGGGIFSALSSVITGNIVTNNSAVNDDGGGIRAGGGLVADNIVSGNTSGGNGGGIYMTTGDVMSNTVTANALTSIYGQGSGIYFHITTGSRKIQYNTIIGNTSPPTATVPIGGMSIISTPEFNYNNIYSNYPYDVVVITHSSNGAISGTHNYWGTVATVDILDHIYDWYDDIERSQLLFNPYLQAPNSNAPVPPPVNFAADFAEDSITLTWEPIPGTSSYNYRIYYDTDAPGPPYDGTGLIQGSSPIDVGNVTNFNLTGWGSESIYLTVTTYDVQGRESWYSNEVNSVITQKIYLPLILNNP